MNESFFSPIDERYVFGAQLKSVFVDWKRAGPKLGWQLES